MKQRIKWLFKELLKMYSNEPSFFSHKRFQTGVAFIVFQHGALWYLHRKLATMDAADFLMWCTPELLICGYTLNAIQKEKLNDNSANTQ